MPAPGLGAAPALIHPTTAGAARTATAAGAAAVAALVTSGETAAGGTGDGAAGCATRGVERGLGSNGALVGEVELLQHELLASDGEVRQGVRISDVVGGTSEAGIEAAQEVEDKLRVGDGAADIAERIGGGLHPLGVVVDGRIALGHGVEPVTQEDGARSFVGLEEVLDGDPKLARSLVRRRSKAKDVWSSGAKEPAGNAGVHEGPSRVSGIGLRRAMHMREKTKFPAKGGEERLPLVEVGLGQFQGHRDVVLDIIA